MNKRTLLAWLRWYHLLQTYNHTKLDAFGLHGQVWAYFFAPHGEISYDGSAILRWRHLQTRGLTKFLAASSTTGFWPIFFAPHEISLKFRMAAGATLRGRRMQTYSSHKIPSS